MVAHTEFIPATFIRAKPAENDLLLPACALNAKPHAAFPQVPKNHRPAPRCRRNQADLPPPCR